MALLHVGMTTFGYYFRSALRLMC